MGTGVGRIRHPIGQAFLTTMNEDLTNRLASLLGRERKDIENMMSALSDIIKESLTEGDSVALPSFGTFSVSKEDETITTDLVTGERLLMPPHITPIFTPSSVLRRRISNNAQ